jgi:metal-responsive CopG/Arc/MetJ family transcriptional regulator
METIQLLLESDLLEAANRAVRNTNSNRSALIRTALREYLHKLDGFEKERLDQEGYKRIPDSLEDSSAWEEATVWPEP